MNSTDYGRFADAAPTPEKIKDLSAAALALYQAEQYVSDAEQRLKDAKAEARRISEDVLPTLMEEAGMAELVLSNGTKLKVLEHISFEGREGRPPVTKRPEVLDWLTQTGNSGLIKRGVLVSLGRDADEREATLLSDVSAMREVHPSTLKSHVKKLLESGASIPMDLLGIRQFKQARITGKPKDGSSAFGE
jgi:hypothetical protein